MQAIQNCMMVAFLYVLSIYAIQNQHYTMHACTRTLKAFKVQSRDISIRLLVTSPFKTVHFQIFCKNYYNEVNGCIFTKLTSLPPLISTRPLDGIFC